jgi:hypothetical protein
MIGPRYGMVSEFGNRVAMVTCSDSVIVGLQIDVITVLSSLAERFAQAGIRPASWVTLTGMPPSDQQHPLPETCGRVFIQ